MLTLSAEEFRQITGARSLQDRHVRFLDWLRVQSGIAVLWPGDGAIDSAAAEVRAKALQNALADDWTLETGNPRRNGMHYVPWSTRLYLGRTPTASERASWPRTLKALTRRGLIQVLEEDGRAVRRTQHLRLTLKAIKLFQVVARESGGILTPLPIVSRHRAELGTALGTDVRRSRSSAFNATRHASGAQGD